jgi:ligand-binding sensor domain-containing protein
MVEVQQMIYKTYSRQDGLVANQVRTVTQDLQGFIWIATWDGLSKYDGNKFTNFNTSTGLAFDVINDLYVDEKNSFYVAKNNAHTQIIRDNKLSGSLPDSITINKFIQSDSTTYAISDHIGISLSRIILLVSYVTGMP